MITPTNFFLAFVSVVWTAIYAEGFVISARPFSRRTLVVVSSAGAQTWNRGLNFGKGDFKFYQGFDRWMSPFPAEDREAYPEIFIMPPGTYEIGMTKTKPLGIVFEEIDVGFNGVFVQELVEGGLAEKMGKIKPGDVLVGITAVKIVGAKWERRLIPARKFDFDTTIGAIQSNDPKFGCNDVILMFERPAEADSAKTDAFLEFFEPPFDSPWKQRQ